MAHLDLDTAALMTASARMRAAASLLEGVWDDVPAGSAAGDAGLRDAVEQVSRGWTSTHRSLVAELDGLTRALAGAARSFETAETLTSDRLATLLVSDLDG